MHELHKSDKNNILQQQPFKLNQGLPELASTWVTFGKAFNFISILFPIRSVAAARDREQES